MNPEPRERDWVIFALTVVACAVVFGAVLLVVKDAAS